MDFLWFAGKKKLLLLSFNKLVPLEDIVMYEKHRTLRCFPDSCEGMGLLFWHILGRLQ